MKLYVDDIRSAPEGWERVRTITQAIRFLATQTVEEVSLDHDIQVPKGTYAVGSSEEDFTAVAWYIAIMPQDSRPKTVYVHTGNSSGAQRIKSILEGKAKLIRVGAFGEAF